MWKRRRAGGDFSGEVQGHLDMETDRLVGDGLSHEDARLAARKAFGSVTAAEERFYESRRILWLDHLRQDIRGAIRAVARYPVAATVAVVSLAFGIGAMTMTLIIRDIVFRRPPALYERPGQLSFVRVGRPDRQMSDPYAASTPGTLLRAWRDAPAAGIAVAAAAPGRLRDVRTLDRTDSVVVRPVSPDLFALLGVGASTGRTFSESSARAAAFKEAVLSRRLWRSLFDGRP